MNADASPVTPDEFLDFLASAIRKHAERLGAELPETAERAAQADIDEYAATRVAQSDRITTTLERRHGDPFNTLLIILDTDFTSDMHTAQRLRRSHEDALSTAATDRLDDVFELLQYTGVARQYFKTLYIQRELAALSQKILYLGLSVVTTSIVTLWLYAHPSGAVLEAVVVVATVVAVAPLAVLVAFVLRITTITRRTASLIPFKIAEESPL